MATTDYQPNENTCWSHMRDEYVTSETYMRCGECFHVFETEADLIRDDAAAWGGEPRTGIEIHICPHCIHDF